MTEIIYKRGKRPAMNPQPCLPDDSVLKSTDSTGQEKLEKVIINSKCGVVKRVRGKRF